MSGSNFMQMLLIPLFFRIGSATINKVQFSIFKLKLFRSLFRSTRCFCRKFIYYFACNLAGEVKAGELEYCC